MRVGDIEIGDFKKYANLFYSYRSASVSSAPEALKNVRQRVDPTAEMDIYSFGMVMWELMYESLPFDGDLQACKQFVLEEDARP